MDFQLSSSSDYSRFEQIVSQFFLKTLHIILESRVHSLRSQGHSGDLSSKSGVNKSDKWFNLALGNRPAVLEKLHYWHRNLMDPMVIDIIVVQQGEQGTSCNDVYAEGAFEGTAVETVVERWVVQFEKHRSVPVKTTDNSSLYKKMYQKSIILFRCLCSMMRLLPAYRIFRRLSSSSQPCDIDVIYKVSSFSHPFSRDEEGTMKQYSFTPVEAVNGRLSVSVSYKPNLSDFCLESSTSFPPLIITDYVGSPHIDPLRALPSVEKVSRATSFSLRGTRSPSAMSSDRPHSWSGGIHKGAIQNYPFSGSPHAHHGSFVPTDIPSSLTNVYGQRVQNYKMSRDHYKGSSFDESLSPPFSPSSSPSGPTYFPNHSPSHSRLRPESAPVTIPHAMLSRTPRYLSPNLSDPNRHSLPPISPRSTRYESSPHGSPSPSGNRSSRKFEGLRTELYSGVMNQSFGTKVSKDSKEESGSLSGLFSSGSSPRKGSSSRLSFQDDLDVCDFSCPFDVDDLDISQASQSLDGRKETEFNSALSLGRKSQDAAVGALVYMLRTAPPLRQDSSCYSARSQSTQQEGNFETTSGFFAPRRTADALEELKSYRDMKDLLLSKSGNRVFTREDLQVAPLDIKGRKI